MSLGATGRSGGPRTTCSISAPPDFDQPHDRNAWVHYQMGDYPAVDLAIDNDAVIPFYSWLAKTYTFSDHHFGPLHLTTCPPWSWISKCVDPKS